MEKEGSGSFEKTQKQKLLNLLFDLSFKYSEEPIFTLAYKPERSQFYIECKNTTLSPEGLVLVGEIIYDMIADLNVDAIGGLTHGADPIAISTATIAKLKGKPIKAFIVRNELKKHGIQKHIEGLVTPGDRVVIVDDVITTGSSTLTAIRLAKEAGLNVIKVIVLVDRQEGGRENITNEGFDVEALFTKDDLMSLYERKYQSNSSKRAISG